MLVQVSFATAYVSATSKEAGIEVLEDLLELAKKSAAPKEEGESFNCSCTNSVHETSS